MSEKRKLLTAIVPCYNEEEALPFFYAEISRVAAEMQAVDFEFLFINDGFKGQNSENSARARVER